MFNGDDNLSHRLSIEDFDETPILFANHFLVHFQPDEFVVSVGQVTGLPLVGTPEEMSAQARAFESVPVHTLARVSLTRRRVMELIGLLQARLDEHDHALRERDVA
jgi:hypothetical protein